MGIFDRFRGSHPAESQQNQEEQKLDLPVEVRKAPESKYSIQDLDDMEIKLEQQGISVRDLNSFFERRQSLQVDNPDIVKYFEMYSDYDLHVPVSEVHLDANFTHADGSDFINTEEGSQINLALYAEDLNDENKALKDFIHTVRHRIQHQGTVMVVYYLGQDSSKIRSELLRNTYNYKRRKK